MSRIEMPDQTPVPPAPIMDCGHHASNRDQRLESQAYFCRLCELQERCRDAEKNESELVKERDRLRELLKNRRAWIGAAAKECAERVLVGEGERAFAEIIERHAGTDR